MADIALDYDDLLDSGGNVWRRRLLLMGLVALIVAAATFGAWDRWFRGGSTTAAPVFTEATVTTGNVTRTISTSGTVSASASSNLNFTAAAKVVKVNVTVGQAVKQGDVLAEIDPTNAQNALTSAQAGLASAQANLDQVLQGSTASQLAAADQSLVQAQTNYTNAGNALQTLQQPPTAAALGAAQQAVTAAQALLQTAQEARTALNTNAQNALQAAQTNVQKAQMALNSAQQAANNASENEQIAQVTLTTAESTYCANPDPALSVSFCAVSATPISLEDAKTMVAVTGGGDAGRAKAAQGVLTADSGYRTAVTADQTASNSLTTAQKDLNSANATLAAAQGQPTSAQVTAAESAISGAQAQLDTANNSLALLQAGPTQAQLDTAQGAVDQATASLAAAEANHDTAHAGSTAAQIQTARTSVQTATITVANAQKALDDTKLVAPFDGTVAARNIQVGDISSSGGASSSSSSSTAAVVLNTPNRLILNLTISETDYPNVKAGNTGIVTFSALSGETFPFVIDTLGANPTTTQGVVTYQAQAHLVTGPQAVQILSSLRGGAGRGSDGDSGAAGAPAAGGTPAAGRTPRGGRTPGAAVGTPGVDTTPVSPPGAGAGGPDGFGQALANQTQPAPGMSATATIIVDQRANVTIVPAKAVQTKNRATVVTVKNANGSTQDVAVTTGLSDNTSTQITSGLSEGQTVEVPGAPTTTTTTGARPATALPATGGDGGGFGDGGGGGAGGHGGG